MHFSLISPRPGHENQAAHQMLQGPYREHQWLWQLFPAEEGTPRDFIFRRTEVGGLPRYHVVSKRPPLREGQAWGVQTKLYQPQLQTGDTLEFELCANPVVTRTVNGKHSRHDVVMDAKRQHLVQLGLATWAEMPEADRPAAYELVAGACTRWLTEQGKRCGFAFRADQISVDSYLQHVIKNGKLKFSTVEFVGTLVVTDAEKFVAMLQSGLGHAKAFGCGLMLVRRPV
ncbi:type I-E CRISPR-associated protein Cas6/Cse3/CasE [Roseateles sp. SL47]|uniref:type I-E CRISPR-associated protein Cas6/Cse3/CasE n=1 Tax=Roseateles sp. SL47 TaxID=2995138 RepID=UPI0022711EFD|nr:type I-E CRISPR-associated protein Cas6/Cse3/CasE [Roseateles sp. SL47]WAC73101.1 type I-E CRISPR-associated protein Cas6/Cse3/CasE [Roseateles sp. SL47]